jgi:peptide chain release factor 1
MPVSRTGVLPSRPVTFTSSSSKQGSQMFEAVEELIGEHADLEKRLADPSVHADQANARKLNKRYAELTPIVGTYRTWKRTGEDIETAREFAADDPDFAAEAKSLEKQREGLTEKLRLLLVPRDPSDDKDVILEVKAGEGGEESALFAGDLLRMYLRYAERVGWKTELIEANESDLGGYKDVQVAVKTKGGNGATEPGQGVWARLKYEGGVHRVQRVPATESQGRIHTSAAGVLVTPEADEVEVEIGPNDLRIDVYRSSGPGGQSVNTTDSAVRITHLPSGLVVSCQNEKSQLQNKESAMRILRSRLLAAAQEEAEREASDARRSQVRTVDRSERIRTYNFPENRISDHRVGFKAYNLDQVLDGDLDAVIQACVDADSAAKLAAAGEN